MSACHRCSREASVSPRSCTNRRTTSGAPRASHSVLPFRRARVRVTGRASDAGIASSRLAGVELRDAAGIRDGRTKRARERRWSDAVRRPGILLGAQRIFQDGEPLRRIGDVAIRRPDRRDGEAVHRDRARLVGHDEVHGTERLLGIQPPDQHVAPEQTICTEAQDDREQDGRFLGDRRDRGGDPGEDVLAQRMAAREADAGREDDEEDRDDQQDPDEPVELPLEGAPTPFSRCETARDPPEFGFLSDRHDDRFSAAADHARSGVGNRPPAGERGIRVVGRRATLLGHRLPRQDASVEEQSVRSRDPRVRRNDIAGLQQHDVAGHEGRRRHSHRRAVTADAGLRSGRCAQRLECAFTAVFGDDVGADDRHQPEQHEQAVAHLADNDREEPGRREHEDERFGRRAHEHSPDGLALRLRQRVGSLRVGASRRIPPGQPCRKIDVQTPRDVRRGERRGEGMSWGERLLDALEADMEDPERARPAQVAICRPGGNRDPDDRASGSLNE